MKNSKLINSMNAGSFRKDPGLFITAILSGVFFAIIFAITLYRYNNFQYHDWDFAIFSNGMWNIIHGKPYISITNVPFLGNHFNVIAFLAAPIFFIFRHPTTLLFLQTLALTLVALPVYFYARKKFDWKISALFPLIYFLYPSLLYVAMYEFHFESIAPFFLALAFYFLASKKNLLFFACSILAMLCKENIPLVVAAMGLYGVLFRPHRRLISFSVLLMGLAYFLLVTLKLQPLFTQGSGYTFQYSQYGESFGNIYIYMLTHPAEIIKDMFSTPLKVDFVFKIFTPLLFLPLLRPDILIMTAPILVKSLLSNIPTTQQITWHYTAPVIPFLIFSLISSCGTIVYKMRLKIPSRVIFWFLCGIVLLEAALGYKYFHGSNTFFVRAVPATYTDSARSEAVKTVKSGSPVIATFDFLPKLSMRGDLYTFYSVWRDFYKNPKNAEYAVLDLNDYFIRKDIMVWPEKISGLLSSYLNNPEWHTAFAKNDIVVLSRNPRTVRASGNIIEITDVSKFNVPSSSCLVIDDSLELLDYAVSSGEKNGELDLTFYWRVKNSPGTLYEMYFIISDGMDEKAFTRHPVAYFYDLRSLGMNKILVEKYSLVLPDQLGPEVYKISIGFVDVIRQKRATVSAVNKNIVNARNDLLLGDYDNR